MKKAISCVIWVCMVLVLLVASCSNQGTLAQCQAPNSRRVWCHCEVQLNTLMRAAAGIGPTCKTPIAVTKCVDPAYLGGWDEYMSALRTYAFANYSDGSDPYVSLGGDGDKFLWLKCPVQTSVGVNDCVTTYPTSPWPAYPTVDLDKLNPLTPGLHGQGYGGAGGAGGSSVFPEGGDCAACLAAASCDGLTQAQCSMLHCAALCPWDDTAMTCESVPASLMPACAWAGEACGAGAVCCDEFSCLPGDVGATCG